MFTTVRDDMRTISRTTISDERILGRVTIYQKDILEQILRIVCYIENVEKRNYF